jgi:multicomponent Na+:H+ antiporter subunit E
VEQDARSDRETGKEGNGTRKIPFSHILKEREPAAFVMTFLIMALLWVILSGKFDAFHLSLGFISCFIVAFFSGDLLSIPKNVKRLPVAWLRFIGYIPWLLYQIFLANLHVLYLTFHPRMMDLIDPKIIKFQSRLEGDLSLVTFANSITLTPGTITVYLSMEGVFSVHAIDKQSREALPGEMEGRIARAFGQDYG